MSVAAALALSLSAVPAAAVPPPPNPSDQDVAAAESAAAAATDAVAAAAAQVTQTNERIGQLEAQVEAATDAHLVAEAQLQQATETVETTAEHAEQAAADVVEAQEDVSQLARESYMVGGPAYDDMLLLSAGSPTDLIERASLLESVAGSQLEVMDRMRIAQVEAANANSAAEQAVIDKQTAEQTAADALTAVTTQLDTASTALAGLQQQLAAQQATLTTAQALLFELEGAQQTYQEWVAAQAAEEAASQAEAADEAAESAASAQSFGGWALPVGGVLTSCFCQRWGTMHWGIDIAAPMYTPIYAAGDGVVLRAGEASGFGLAVYIEHANGDITVYGHMEVMTVSAGQTVAGGQLIAKVGSRGFSTGPHLHFEVHTGGLYAGRVDPIDWLADRGIYL